MVYLQSSRAQTAGLIVLRDKGYNALSKRRSKTVDCLYVSSRDDLCINNYDDNDVVHYNAGGLDVLSRWNDEVRQTGGRGRIGKGCGCLESPLWWMKYIGGVDVSVSLRKEEQRGSEYW